jgi:ubiquitin conjugation factor E4 A
VPEFLIENLVSFLSFIRHFSPRTLEEQGFALLDPLLTQVLVFMGSSERMRNPHLRARMAECLESLLPHHNEEQPALNPNPLGSFYRERLFKAHPHRKQVYSKTGFVPHLIFGNLIISLIVIMDWKPSVYNKD